MAGKGGVRPGAGRPRGEMNHAVKEFAARCRKFLESPGLAGIPRFERVAESLLEPEVACRRNSKGEEIPGTEYLVNASSMVAMLDLLAGYAYGKPRQQVEHGGAVAFFEAPVESPAETREQWLERMGAATVALDEGTAN